MYFTYENIPSQKENGEETMPSVTAAEVKNFTPDEIDHGISKLRRRLDEVLKVGSLRYDDPRIANVGRNIQETIREVFGTQSSEFQESQYFEFSAVFSHEESAEERQEKFLSGVRVADALLHNLIGRLEEKREDLVLDPAARFRATLEGFDLHPRIAEVSTQLYREGHYGEAVFTAAKALVLLVREKTGNPKGKNDKELDGKPLMERVFSLSNPFLTFNDLRDDTDRSEQEGMMHLFVGAVSAIRNPRGHKFLYDSPERALEFIVFLSMLARRLEEAKVIPSVARSVVTLLK